MFTFCDVLHEAKQKKNINKLSRVRSTDWKSALIKRRNLYYLQVDTRKKIPVSLTAALKKKTFRGYLRTGQITL